MGVSGLGAAAMWGMPGTRSSASSSEAMAVASRECFSEGVAVGGRVSGAGETSGSGSQMRFALEVGASVVGVVGAGQGFVGGFELREVFPEEVAAVDDFAAAHVEEVDGEHVLFVVEAEDVGVFVVGGGDALLVLHLVDGDDLVAQAGGELELHVVGGLVHAGGEARFELAGLAFEEELHVADGLA